MIDTIKDVNFPVANAIKTVTESLVEDGYRPFSMTDLQTFADLYSDLSNHTRMPSNRGFRPVDIYIRTAEIHIFWAENTGEPVMREVGHR